MKDILILISTLLIGGYKIQPPKTDTLMIGDSYLAVTINQHFVKQIIPEVEGPVLTYDFETPSTLCITNNSLMQFEMDNYSPSCNLQLPLGDVTYGMKEGKKWFVSRYNGTPHLRFYYEQHKTNLSTMPPITSILLYYHPISGDEECVDLTPLLLFEPGDTISYCNEDSTSYCETESNQNNEQKTIIRVLSCCLAACLLLCLFLFLLLGRLQSHKYEKK